jgi:hypothetical protein
MIFYVKNKGRRWEFLIFLGVLNDKDLTFFFKNLKNLKFATFELFTCLIQGCSKKIWGGRKKISLRSNSFRSNFFKQIQLQTWTSQKNALFSSPNPMTSWSKNWVPDSLLVHFFKHYRYKVGEFLIPKWVHFRKSVKNWGVFLL